LALHGKKEKANQHYFVCQAVRSATADICQKNFKEFFWRDNFYYTIWCLWKGCCHSILLGTSLPSCMGLCYFADDVATLLDTSLISWVRRYLAGYTATLLGTALLWWRRHYFTVDAATCWGRRYFMGDFAILWRGCRYGDGNFGRLYSALFRCYFNENMNCRRTALVYRIARELYVKYKKVTID
jgi:hypothetical protein